MGGRARLRQALVVAQVAVTLVLLVGAGLLVRSFIHLQHVDQGFTAERVLSFWLDLPPRKYATEEQQLAFYRDVHDALRALPGVEEVGFASQLPLDQNAWQTGFLIEGRPVPPPSERPSMEVTIASPDYFRAMGISLRAGRYFDERDTREHLRGRDLGGLTSGLRRAAGLNAIIVDEGFAERYWPGEDAVGKRVKLPWSEDPDRQPVLTVVGVVARVQLERPGAEAEFVQAYLPLLQAAGGGTGVVIKTRQEPEALAAAARGRVQALDPEQPIYDVKTMAEVRADALAPQRLNLALLGAFAAAALLLAAVGLYGVISYSVTQRTQEIGVRMALGARAWDVLRLVIGEGMRLALTGVAAGVVAALAAAPIMKSLLFGVSATDPATFVALAALLTLVTLAACWVPAWRATRVDPTVALRYE
jgi:putative ABC transport system permease protein